MFSKIIYYCTSRAICTYVFAHYTYVFLLFTHFEHGSHAYYFCLAMHACWMMCAPNERFKWCARPDFLLLWLWRGVVVYMPLNTCARTCVCLYAAQCLVFAREVFFISTRVSAHDFCFCFFEWVCVVRAFFFRTCVRNCVGVCVWKTYGHKSVATHSETVHLNTIECLQLFVLLTY